MATVLGHEFGARRRARPRREARRSTCSTTPTTLDEEPVRRRAASRRRAPTSPSSGPRSPTSERPDLAHVGLSRHLARGRPRDRGRRAHPRRRAHARPHARATTSSPTAPAGLLFAGDHVLPTITPSIGFTGAADAAAAGRLHGLADQGPRRCPTCGSCRRTARSRRRPTPASTSCSPTTSSGSSCASPRSRPAPADGVRRRRRPAAGPATSTRSTSSTSSTAGMAAMETKAHLELLVARGQATRGGDRRTGVVFTPVSRLSRIGRCGMPSSRNSSPLDLEAERGVPARAAATARRAPRRGPGRPAARPASAGRPGPGRGRSRCQHHPADPPGVAVVEHPRAADQRRRRRRSSTWRVPGSRSRPSRSG